MKNLFVLIAIMIAGNILFAQSAAYTMVIKKDDGSYVQVSLTENVVFAFHPRCVGTPKVHYEGGPYNDSDGNGEYYSTILIGDQCWLRENLNVGTKINVSVNMSDNETIEKYCYDESDANCTTYGGLYQWNEAMQYATTEGTQGICPTGWHIPTEAELQTLIDSVGGDGNALKALGEGSGDGAGINLSGFSALLAGNRYLDSFYGEYRFQELGAATYFWSSTQYDSEANFMYVYNLGSDIYNFYNLSKDYGFSVRCIKD